MDRQRKIEEAALYYASLPMDEMSEDVIKVFCDMGLFQSGFVCSSKWSDENPKSPWISAKDKLPEKGKPVLTRMVSFYKEEKPVFLVNVLKENGWKETMKQYYKVTHWMNIPLVPPIVED